MTSPVQAGEVPGGRKVAKQQKNDWYKLERFSPEQLARLPYELSMYAEAINGLTQHHSEALEKRGWLLPFLFTYDDLLWGRWSFWTDILLKGTIESSGHIPQITWTEQWSPETQATKKMLSECMNHYEATIDNFADWLLWGLAATLHQPKVSEALNELYYRQFDLFLIVDNPTDYLSNLLSIKRERATKLDWVIILPLLTSHR